jgi:hypothetical protein
MKMAGGLFHLAEFRYRGIRFSLALSKRSRNRRKLMTRIEQQSITKRYQVLQEGFIIGFVEAKTSAEAEIMAQDRYGVGVKLGCIFELNQPTEFLEDELGNRAFRIEACYRADFIPVVKQSPALERVGDQIVQVGMKEETFGEIGRIVDQWFLHHPGIHIIHFGSSKDPETNAVGFLVVYYTMIELPIIHTLDELCGQPGITEAQLREQRDFLVRLTVDLRSNDALFDHARALGVEWIPAKHPVTERGNCVQALRRFHGWI